MKVSIVIYLQTCYVREGGSSYFYTVSSSLFECGLNLHHPTLYMYSYMTCPFGLDDDHMFFFVHECICMRVRMYVCMHYTEVEVWR
jgi:hypothetical protein